MPDLDRIAKLVDKLIQLTTDNKVSWSETADEGTFESSLPNYTVTIAQERVGENWGEPIHEYRMKVRDLQGKVLEEAGHSDFRDTFLFKNGETARSAMKSLHDLARRRALRVDEALEGLLSSLEEM